LDAAEPDLSIWEDIVLRVNYPLREIKIAIVGKYIKLRDAYKSVTEALNHSGIALNAKVSLKWINSRRLSEENIEDKLSDVHGILVPGGFGFDGTEGMILAINYARVKKIPFFGICLGMQLAIIEISRNICGLDGASSSEFGECSHPVIGLMTEWLKKGSLEKRSGEDDLGGTMRLGSYECSIKAGSLAEHVYGSTLINERHRHRYEVNINYRTKLEKAGLSFSGMSPDGNLTEIIELNDHPFFIAVQFHPELKSRPFAPHPIFYSLIKASLEHANL
jgi:CTP synthase